MTKSAGRSRCVRKKSTSSSLTTSSPSPLPPKSKKVVPHDEFIERIRKSLYFGGNADFDEEDLNVSRPLAEYASELFSQPHKGHSLNRLNSAFAGGIQASPCSLIMALIYLDRLNAFDPGYVRRVTPQELFIVSMMISTKFYTGHDEEVYLSDWAEDGNMKEEDLKHLEMEFLCAIDWNLYISNEQFFSKLQTIEKTLAKREGLRRGWLTYSELKYMLPSFTFASFILNNVAMLAVTYAAGVLTIASAFFIASHVPGHALYRKSTPANSNAVTTETQTYLLEKAPLNRTDKQDLVVTTTNNCTLNVAAELLKLEEQYREEAKCDELKKRNNEICTESRLTLPHASLEGPTASNRAKHNQNHVAESKQNWFNLKYSYSDYIFSSFHTTKDDFAASFDFVDDKVNFNRAYENYTAKYLLWKLIMNSRSIDHFALLRFKFI